MRQISSAALEALQTNLGEESVLIVEIQWVKDGPRYSYADKDVPGRSLGKILELSPLDNAVVVQGVSSGTTGDSQQISIKLDDRDGSIKAILDTHDIHKRNAWVYQWFTGLDFDDKFLIFKGQVSSPLEWNEGSRDVKLDIISKIEDAEYGFSMEEGDFKVVPEELVGVAWPLVFGENVVNVPATRLRTPKRGILRTGFGIVDYVLRPKMQQIAYTACAIDNAGWGVIGLNSPNAQYQMATEQNKECGCKKAAMTCEVATKINVQEQYQYNPVSIGGGENFEQGVPIILNINGAHVHGHFQGTTNSPSNSFYITKRVHPGILANDPPLPKVKRSLARVILGQGGAANYGVGSNTAAASGARCQITVTGGGNNGEIIPNCTLRSGSGWVTAIGSGKGGNFMDGETVSANWDYLSQFQEAGFFWAEAGSEVTLVTNDETPYVVNLIPSTVLRVAAYKTNANGGPRVLTQLPNEWYYVRYSDFNTYTITEVVLAKPLSLQGEGWEDELFITQTSSVGPNTVDILEWLIDTYTDFTWDSSFNYVKGRLENYPMNFYLGQRGNILQLLKELAFQNRCALTLRNDVFHLTYLAEDPEIVDSITESDVFANTLTLTHTDTEELVTKFVAEWQDDYSMDEVKKYIARYNVNRYGTQEQTFNFFAFNVEQYVKKTATFWLIRMGNTWRKFKAQVPVGKLTLESIDGVNVTLPDIAQGTTKCRIESAIYNSDDNAIDVVVWTPVRSGERTKYDFAYPADISETILYPTVDDLKEGRSGGTGPNVNVRAPSSHVLAALPVTYNPSPDDPCSPEASLAQRTLKCRPDQGDRKPSDADDQKVTKLPPEDNVATPPATSPVSRQPTADQIAYAQAMAEIGQSQSNRNAANDAMNAATGGSNQGTSGGGQGGANDNNGQGGDALDGDRADKQKDLEALPPETPCAWLVNIYTFNVRTVRVPGGSTCESLKSESNPGGVCNADQCNCNTDGTAGTIIGNVTDFSQEVFGFSDEASAREFLASVSSSLPRPGEQGQVGSPAYAAGNITSPAGDCVVDMENPQPAGALVSYSPPSIPGTGIVNGGYFD